MIYNHKKEMEKVVLYNIPFRDNPKKLVYHSGDPSIPTTDRKVLLPINNYLGASLKKDDSVKAVLIAKKDSNEHYLNNLAICKNELSDLSKLIGTSIDSTEIISPFTESKEVHYQLLTDIVNAIPMNAHISVDMTYGPKDLAIVLFTALKFATKYMNCEVDNIMYGQVEFNNNELLNATLCEMSPLFYLESIISLIRCDDPDRAKDMLNSILNE